MNDQKAVHAWIFVEEISLPSPGPTHIMQGLSRPCSSPLLSNVSTLALIISYF